MSSKRPFNHFSVPCSSCRGIWRGSTSPQTDSHRPHLDSLRSWKISSKNQNIRHQWWHHNAIFWVHEFSAMKHSLGWYWWVLNSSRPCPRNLSLQSTSSFWIWSAPLRRINNIRQFILSFRRALAHRWPPSQWHELKVKFKKKKVSKRTNYSLCSYLVLVRVRQSLGGFGPVWKLNVKAQDVTLPVSVRIMLSYGLMEARSFLTAPRVAELIITQRSLKVSWDKRHMMNTVNTYCCISHTKLKLHRWEKKHTDKSHPKQFPSLHNKPFKFKGAEMKNKYEAKYSAINYI